MHSSRRWRCLLVWVLFFTMAGGLLTPPARAAAYSDISKHWAKADIEFVSGQGIIAGYSDNTFQPDRNVTRAEYIAMINRTFKLTASLPTTFSDVKSSDWFAADMGKARAAGYVSGYSDGTVRPQKSITRQEAAYMIAKVLGLSSASVDTVSKYKDKKNIGTWSLDAVAAVVNRGYMSGYPDNTFRPANSIKRAEAAVGMRAVFGSTPGKSTPLAPISQGNTVYDQAGTYGPSSGQQSVQGAASITASGVTLRNTSVSGDLLIAGSVGSGSVTLSNVVVQGTLKVEGGGPNSVTLDNSTISDVIVSKAGVRVVARGSTDVNRAVLTAGATLEESSLSGSGFKNLTITSTGGIGVDLSGSFDSVTTSASADIALSSGSRIATLTLNSSARVTGNGTIGTANINASGVYIAQTPGNTFVSSNYSASVGGQTVTGTTGIASTTDNGLPAFVSGYPKKNEVTDNSLEFLVKIDKAGRVYYVVLDSSSSTPTPYQVKSGTNASGSSVSSSMRGVIYLNRDNQNSVIVSNLSPSTSYRLYVVAEDTDQNLQSSVETIYFTTEASGYGTLSFSDYSATVAENASSVTITVDRNGTSSGTARVYYSTANGTAYAGSDYTLTSGYLEWPSGVNISKSFVIPIINDSTVEGTETFSVSLSSPLGASVGSPSTMTVSITDDETAAGIISFSSSAASVAESVYSVSLTVNRSGSGSGYASVYYSTANLTASAGNDYTATSGILTWANGDITARTITIPILDDRVVEGTETFVVNLTGVTGASLGTATTVTVTIYSDDVAFKPRKPSVSLVTYLAKYIEAAES